MIFIVFYGKKGGVRWKLTQGVAARKLRSLAIFRPTSAKGDHAHDSPPTPSQKDEENRNSHHEDEQHQYGRRDYRKIDDSFSCMSCVNTLEQNPCGFLIPIQSPQRVRFPFQRAEQYELYQNEPENRTNPQLAKVDTVVKIEKFLHSK
ncbi:hypothetical protein PanWU01x14_334400 [Parasponia andersonii]|uniref:Uncharacterized protein n=1 Tax=Parasponia andersonii TaxID=3476 RepID=A0A2P5AGJ4_PARAD|nr:hypothetical protein PanWU01x14_334400 [Parasponia andersonii]